MKPYAGRPDTYKKMSPPDSPTAWSDSVETMSGVLNFLGLEMTDAYAALVRQIVYPKDPNIKYASFPLPEVPRARRIMELYSY